MSNVVHYRLPCPHCTSSDAYHIYEDGHGYCFSCSHYDPPDSYGDNLSDTYSFQYLPWRGITAESFERYRVATKVAADGTPLELGFPYGGNRVKVRSLSSKTFNFVGDKDDPNQTPLFGQAVFDAGGNKHVVVTEGELDAISVYQLLSGRVNSVSVRSASSAETDCKKARDYLNSFERIYLAFDNDPPGQEAKLKVARLFDYNKVYDVKLTRYKDANEYLTENAEDEFRDLVRNSKKFQPEGIVSTYAEIAAALSRESKRPIATFPFSSLQACTGGLRLGERVLFTALEGVGKTEYVRAIEHHILKTTDLNLGIIHLEEPQERSIRGLIGYELGTPCHLPTSVHSVDELTARWQGLVKRDERVHFYSHFGSSDPDVILDRIRFMVAVLGCRVVTLDHISMVVSGLGDSKERENLDYISTRLAMMTNELDFNLIFVSHVNDEGLTRGSRNISKIADIWVHIHRDHLAEDEVVRNTSSLIVKKNRPMGITGLAGKLYFNPKTFMLSESPYVAEPRMPPVTTADYRPSVST